MLTPPSRLGLTLHSAGLDVVGLEAGEVRELTAAEIARLQARRCHNQARARR